jgi:hypothetical protein
MRLLVIFALCYSSCTLAQVFHPNAHAHNDYEHPRPLLDALASRFGSVEADIHLIDGDLYVSHHRPRLSEARTFQALYLGPLDSLCKNDVFQGLQQSFILLVDIKTDATRTLEKLIEVLHGYPGLSSPDSPVRLVISGNRDYELITKTAGLSIDGRPKDLGKGYSSDKMPWISDHFGNVMHWNGEGDPSTLEVDKVRALARRVHAEGKRLRLWAIPDREEAWGVLLDAGVDVINTDRLDALDEFLRRRG